MAEDLYLEEIKDVVNIDFSENCIKLMEDKYKSEVYEEIQLKFKKMDINDLSEFGDNEFDVIFDKAVLDSVLCGENALPIVANILKGLHRVLKPGGVYIIVSNGNEENRKSLFDENLWEYQMQLIDKKMVVLDEKDPKNYYYIYILTKKALEEKKEEPEKVEEKKEETPAPAPTPTPAPAVNTKTKKK